MTSETERPPEQNQPDMCLPDKPSWLRRALGRVYRWGRGVLALGMLLHIVLVCTPIPEALYRWLCVDGPAVKADAIICLGGEISRDIMAARLYRRGYAPKVIVSNRPGAAQGMRDNVVLVGVPDERVLVDETSYITGDHPKGVAALPGIEPDKQHFLIVTGHPHGRRAAACFRRAGFQHFTIYSGPSALDYIEPSKLWRWRVRNIPVLAYELAALIQYKLQGKI